ncbi:MAG: hypothetical protein ACK2UO_16610 [Caldilineaceae bacterium]
MRLPFSLLARAKSALGLDAPAPTRRLTRKEFYDLAAYCHVYAEQLAEYDQTRVNLARCNEFNQWLPTVKSYDLLQPRLETLKPARPIARWQVLTLVAVAGLLLFLIFGRRLNQSSGPIILYGFMFSMLIFAFFVPERLYGTTIELLEAKVLRVVEALEQILRNEELGYSEAAYFQVKDNLEAARQELRQQIDLAHRRWR